MVEILVAVILLSIGVLGTAQLVVGSESTSLDAELQQIATAEAESALEEVLALQYGEIGHVATPAPAEPDGENRINGNNFTAPDASEEQLVIPANSEAGDSDGGVIGGGSAPQVKPFSISSGDATINGKAYVFVTWRDEECEEVDLTSLQSGVAALQGELTALRTQLSGLLTDVDDLLGISLLPSEIRAIYETLVPGLINDLDDTVDGLDGLLTALATAEIDLCDLSQEALDAIDGLVDPDGVGGFEASAEVLGVAGEVSAAADIDVPNLGLITTLTCALLGTFCDDSKDLETEINAGGIGAKLTGIDADAQALGTELATDTTHNSKRVTVGVEIDTRSDVTPQNVVWVSEVVTDPNEGLL